MQENIGKSIRLSDFIDSRDNRTILLDTTMASCVGATPGLEDLSSTIEALNNCLDGVIVNPGQAEHLAHLLGGKKRAVSLIRVDWSNAFRGQDFCLPTAKIHRVEISNGEDALDLGASAVVASFLMGFDEDFESENIKSISLLTRECYSLSLPVVVDVRPIGGKVTSSNFSGTIKLGASFMLEAGADALIIPDSDADTNETIGSWITIPVILRLEDIPTTQKVNEIFKAGLSGVLLSERVLVAENYQQKIAELYSFVHSR